MKYIWFSLLSLNALSIELPTCSDVAFSHGENGIVLSEDCKLHLVNSPLKASMGEKQSVYGLNNMILTYDDSITAGPETLLSQIVDMKISPEEDRVYVLNQDGRKSSILSFPAEYGGNIAPRRKLITDELENATGFVLDFPAKRIYAISQMEGWIKAFNLHADPDGRLPEHSTELLFEAPLEPLAAKDLSVSSSEVFVLEGDRIRVLSKNLEPKLDQVIEGAGQLSNATHIEYDQTKKALIASNHEGPIMTFIKDSNGLFVPEI